MFSAAVCRAPPQSESVHVSHVWHGQEGRHDSVHGASTATACVWRRHDRTLQQTQDDEEGKVRVPACSGECSGGHSSSLFWWCCKQISQPFSVIFDRVKEWHHKCNQNFYCSSLQKNARQFDHHIIFVPTFEIDIESRYVSVAGHSLGKFRWLGHVMRREPPSMLHEVVNYKVKGTRPRGRPRTTWLKSMDNQLKEKGSSMKDVMSQNLYQDRSAWRTLFVNWQELIFLRGDWLERLELDLLELSPC